MTRTKHAAKKGKAKGKASSSLEPEIEEEEFIEEMEAEEERQFEPEEPVAPTGRGKRRKPEEVRAAKQKVWEVSVKGRHVKNERHIEVDGFGGNNRCISRITAQGLSFWLGPNPGYNKELVCEFYKNMRIPEAGKELSSDAKIISKIGKIPITIDPDVIASSLSYSRPTADGLNYFGGELFDADTVNRALYINPSEAKEPHVPGKFKEEYRILNHLIHYNINPRGTENKPSPGEGCMLFAFMHSDYVCDWALYIFRKMIDFKAHVSKQTRLPYPCLITSICVDHGVTSQKYSSREKLLPGAIDSTILTKSISQSRIPRATPRGTYLTTMPTKKARQSTWMKLLFCQGVAIMASNKKLKKETRENTRRQERIEHRLDWITRREEGSTSEPYVPPPIVEHEDSDDFAVEEPDDGCDDEDEE